MCLSLGIDTSNYTTSVALCRDGEIIAQKKTVLSVREGERGLRQSDAVFAHTQNLPRLFEELFSEAQFAKGNLDCIGYSATPRDAKGSYMPCFLAGEAIARSLSASTRVPAFAFSHQCGHIAAALYKSGFEPAKDACFAAFHISGGTTEILLVRRDREKIYSIEKIGGTLDLNAGQIIDRTGVLLGLTFPCGMHLEKLAIDATKKFALGKVSVHGLECNLSGIENQIKKLIGAGEQKADIARYTLEYLCRFFEKLTENLRETYPSIPVLYAGGVMTNQFIRSRLCAFGDCYFALPGFSSDNAAGIALLAQRKYQEM